jgi:hypothetical protein
MNPVRPAGVPRPDWRIRRLADDLGRLRLLGGRRSWKLTGEFLSGPFGGNERLYFSAELGGPAAPREQCVFLKHCLPREFWPG